MHQARLYSTFSFQSLKQHSDLFEKLMGTSFEALQPELERMRPGWEKLLSRKKVSGRPYRIPDLENHVLALMLYYRARVTYNLIGQWYGVNETTAMRRIKCVEPLVQRMTRLRKDRQLTREDVQAIIDQLDERISQNVVAKPTRRVSAMQSFGRMGQGQAA
uniref:Transposase Helix-turn-helix domain-containing protein n=1 Tax=Magnetococcus massalia (strain MO-1) TaxID=451514 RepID=A0A1S7LCM4_MAGMO|nr:conserved protein of unknown function [Candidatus Magnetococcus massalia]